MKKEQITIMCAWCGDVIWKSPDEVAVSHGMCETCAKKMRDEAAANRARAACAAARAALAAARSALHGGE